MSDIELLLWRWNLSRLLRNLQQTGQKDKHAAQSLTPSCAQTTSPAHLPWNASPSSVCLASTGAKSAAGLLIFISLSFTRRRPHASQIQENNSKRGREEGGLNPDKSQFFLFIGFYFMCNNAFSPARRGDNWAHLSKRAWRFIVRNSAPRQEVEPLISRHNCWVMGSKGDVRR